MVTMSRFYRQRMIVSSVGYYRSLTTPPPRPPGFFQKLVDSIKQDMSKSKEMQQHLKKFREETDKLELTDNIKKMREKFEKMEPTTKSTVIKDKMEGFYKDTIEEAKKSEYVKKAGSTVSSAAESLGKTAAGAAESFGKTGENLSRTEAFKTVSRGMKAVKEEIDDSTLKGAHMYRSPEKLRKRKEGLAEFVRVVEENPDATGVELHKDSKWFAQWEDFKNNNQYINKMTEIKIKYDESENPVIRASRAVTNKVTDLMGGIFQQNELSEALTEICKMDSEFSKEQFLKDCEMDIIPNILEAMVRGDLDILQDWCHEAAFNVMAVPIKQAYQMGYRFVSRVIDVDNVDLAMGSVTEQGPILVISFQSQQILCVKDTRGKVIEGDEDKVLRVTYVWVLCRDQTELNPRAAWRLLQLSASSQAQMI